MVFFERLQTLRLASLSALTPATLPVSAAISYEPSAHPEGGSQSFFHQGLGPDCCSLGGFRISDEQIEKILDIDGVMESLVYNLVIGK
jgi:hypothetical protein